VVLSDQLRSLDWRARKAARICALPSATINEVVGKLRTLIDAR
jgi:mRNA-degrading endonuclease toxin of MazEF toxin-antitoxin module